MTSRIVMSLCLGTAFVSAASLCTNAAAQSDTGRSNAATASERASTAELEFWRSTERIASPQAYRAYLAAFPNGLFAPLAKAALGSEPANLPAPGPQTSPVISAGPPPKASAALRYFSESPANSGAIAINIGDRFVGPGAMMMGWVGAKRQLVLPEGEWVALAAEDSTNTAQLDRYRFKYSASLTTVVFGKFSGDRLIALMRFTGNSRPANVPTWTDIDGCDAGGPARLHHERTRPNAFREDCLSIRSAADPMAEPWPGAAETRQSLTRLGASYRGAGIVTTLTMGELRWGYMGITRIDWPGPVLGTTADQAASWQADTVATSPQHKAYVKALIDWTTGYRKVAADGYRRDFDGATLTPGVPAAAAAPSAPVSDFEPGRAAAAR